MHRNCIPKVSSLNLEFNIDIFIARKNFETQELPSVVILRIAAQG